MRKYNFTDELRAELREAYCGSRRQISGKLDRLCWRTKWPRTVLIREASRMGMSVENQHPWSKEEFEYLQEYLGARPVATVARALGRSVHSVRVKAKRMHLSIRAKEGYSAADLAAVFGVHASTVRRWMSRGLLGKVHEWEGMRVAEASVVKFVRCHPAEYNLRAVDQYWFKGLVFGRTGFGG